MPLSPARLRLVLAIKLLVSGGLLWWVLTRPQLADFGRVLARGDWRWLTPAIVCGGLTVFFSALRWQVCLGAVGLHLPLATTLRITLAANAAGYFSIGTLGNDATRVLLVGKHLGGSHLRATSSLAIDHTSSAPAMIVLLGAALAPLGLLPTIRSEALPVLGITAVLTVVIGLAIRWKWNALHARILGFLSDRATWRGLGLASLISFPVWLSFAGIFYCMARAMGVVVPPVPFAGICAIADAISSLPISVAGLGVREQAYQTMLEMHYQVPASMAVATSLAGFGVVFLWGMIGALCLLAEPAGKVQDPP